MRLPLLSLLITLLPVFSFAQNNPGFLGKKRVIKFEHGLFIQGEGQAHGFTREATSYSFIPEFIRNRNRVGVSYEQLFRRKFTLVGGLYRYSSYANNQVFYLDNENAMSSEMITMASESSDNFRSNNTQLSIGARLYNKFAPVGAYVEFGLSAIYYTSPELTFKESKSGDGYYQPVEDGLVEQVSSSGLNWMGHIAFGFNQFLTDDVFVGFDLRLHMRTFGYVPGWDGMPNSDLIFETDLSLEDRVSTYNKFHSSTAIGVGFSVSVGYMF